MARIYHHCSDVLVRVQRPRIGIAFLMALLAVPITHHPSICGLHLFIVTVEKLDRVNTTMAMKVDLTDTTVSGTHDMLSIGPSDSAVASHCRLVLEVGIHLFSIILLKMELGIADRIVCEAAATARHWLVHIKDCAVALV